MTEGPERDPHQPDHLRSAQREPLSDKFRWHVGLLIGARIPTGSELHQIVCTTVRLRLTWPAHDELMSTRRTDM